MNMNVIGIAVLMGLGVLGTCSNYNGISGIFAVRYFVSEVFFKVLFRSSYFVGSPVVL